MLAPCPFVEMIDDNAVISNSTCICDTDTIPQTGSLQNDLYIKPHKIITDSGINLSSVKNTAEIDNYKCCFNEFRC